VERGLAGASFEKKLVSLLGEGLAIQPLYTRGDLPDAGAGGEDPAGFPGAPPLTRGAWPLATPGGWEILQRLDHPDPSAAAEQAAVELSRGATGLRLTFDAAFRAGLSPSDPAALGLLGEGGVHVSRADQLAPILARLGEESRLAIDAGGQPLAAAALVQAACALQGLEPSRLQLSLDADPIGALARDGALPLQLEAALEDLGELALWAKAQLPLATTALVSTEAIHHAGADAVQELAIALSTGARYLRALEAAGLSIEDAADQIVFQLQVGSDVFVEIAKLRTARRLWCRILEASGVESPRMTLHAQTAWRSMTARDPWVNMLRATVAAFAGAAGGAQAFTVRPFDAAVSHPDDFARRIARNTQLILRDESQLHRVIDPAGGSFYVENLSEELGAAAWSELQSLEAAGGVGAALLEGSLQRRLAETAAERRNRIARRKLPITGVSEFPHLEERPLARQLPDLESLRAKWVKDASERGGAVAGAGVEAAQTSGAPGGAGSASRDASERGASRLDRASELAAGGADIGALAGLFSRGGPTRIEPLRFERLSEPFERLRDRSDAQLASAGVRPKVFLANLGPVARHLARAMFADNFFGAGGIETQGNDGFADAAEAAAAFTASGAKVAAICGADADYEAMIPAFAAALRSAGATRIYVAGRPGAHEEAWRKSGVDGFIFMGSDLVACLEDTLDHMGVGR